MIPIDRVVLTHVRVPLVEPFRISSGEVAEKDAIVVAVRSEGYTGYGESSPMAGSFYSADTPERCWEELCAALERHRDLRELRVGNFSRAGFETALADIEAQKAGQPLWKFLGGVRGAVESGLAVGLYDTIPQTLRAAERYLAAGYKRVKFKIQPGRDVGLIREARKAFGDLPMFVDANGAYTLKDLSVFRRLDEFGLMMFEQPFAGPRLEDHAELQAAVATPVCLDESLESVELLERAISLGSLRIANIKIQRVGGLDNAKRMHDICERHGIPCWMGTMPELGIGGAQAAAMAALPNCRFPTDVEASERWFRDDIVTPPIEVSGGLIELPGAPGLGWRVDERKLEKYRIVRREFA
jgi:O-succinylbenzoate synthase